MLAGKAHKNCTMSTTENELALLKNWLKNVCLFNHFELQPLVDDASFRRYFRIHVNQTSYVVMLAPPDKENIAIFIAIAKNFAHHGIHVPKIIAYELDRGFVLLSDLGKDLYLNLLNKETVDDLYMRALTVIPQIQTCHPRLQNKQSLGLFDEALIRFELSLFVDWFLARHIKLNLTHHAEQVLKKSFNALIASALEQPQACMHRDYHSRNLLLIDNTKVGVLDFQDAVYGPITYDAVSLLRDAYIDWPEKQVEQWALNFRHLLNQNYRVSSEKFLRWFDLLSIQRHLKILGIFARLCYRDNKPQYLDSTHRLLNYLHQTCEKYPEFHELTLLLQTDFYPQSLELEKK